MLKLNRSPQADFLNSFNSFSNMEIKKNFAGVGVPANAEQTTAKM